MDYEDAKTLLTKHGLTVEASMTEPKRQGKKPKPVWLVRGRLDPFRELLYELGGKTRFTGRNTFSFWDDPTIEIAEGIEAQGEATIEEQVALKDERSEARAERYDQRASNQLRQRDHAYQRSSAAVAGIPPGQPVLVGHHSEKRHRAALNKSHQAMHKAVEADRKATKLNQKAANSQAQIRQRQSKSYMENRLREAEAKKRQAERDLARRPDSQTYKLELSDAEAAIAHWSAALEEAGVLTQDDIAKGDYVLFGRRWYEVVRVNPKSVTVTGWMDIDGWQYRLKYGEIKDHKTQAGIREAVEQRIERLTQTGKQEKDAES